LAMHGSHALALHNANRFEHGLFLSPSNIITTLQYEQHSDILFNWNVFFFFVLIKKKSKVKTDEINIIIFFMCQ
jgi:hypothetical protein